MGDLTAIRTEDGQILVTLSDNLRVDKDVYVLTLELAEKLKVEIEAILDIAKLTAGNVPTH